MAKLRINKNLGGIEIPEEEHNELQFAMQVQVDEETLMKAKALEDRSKYFHALDKGCIFELREVYFKKSKRFRPVQFCLTHNANCCRCGWEIHHHYDTDSLDLGVINYLDKEKYV